MNLNVNLNVTSSVGAFTNWGHRLFPDGRQINADTRQIFLLSASLWGIYKLGTSLIPLMDADKRGHTQIFYYQRVSAFYQRPD